MFYPFHKKKKNKNKKNKKNNPSPKSISRGCTRRLKFDAKTIHGLFAEFRGLRVLMTLFNANNYIYLIINYIIY